MDFSLVWWKILKSTTYVLYTGRSAITLPRMVAYTECFSPDYFVARHRFRLAARNAGFATAAFPIAAKGPSGEPLTIDVATMGKKSARKTFVLSSGLHGVEGFLGSAVQLASIERFIASIPIDDLRVVFIHALNPYGFAWLRRVNEKNVDLNRNFLIDGNYTGCDSGYKSVHALLNPQSPPKKISSFAVRGALLIARKGLGPLKQAVASGQYEYPQGMYFGGNEPSETMEILRDNLGDWIGQPERVLHVDIHSGLGAFGDYKLFVDHGWNSEGLRLLAGTYGSLRVEAWDAERGTSYAIRGGLGSFCKHIFPEVNYDVVCAEFGTASPLAVCGALRAENRAHHFLAPKVFAPSSTNVFANTVPNVKDRNLTSLQQRYQVVKENLVEVFCPSSVAWRSSCVSGGLGIVEQSLRALQTTSCVLEG